MEERPGVPEREYVNRRLSPVPEDPLQHSIDEITELGSRDLYGDEWLRMAAKVWWLFESYERILHGAPVHRGADATLDSEIGEPHESTIEAIVSHLRMIYDNDKQWTVDQAFQKRLLGYLGPKPD